MNDLITMIDGNAVLDHATADLIANFEKQVKEIKEKEDALKSLILEAMENNGIVKIETDELTINYVAKTDRETFDSKTFRKDHADLYDDYVKITPVKPSIRIKIK